MTYAPLLQLKALRPFALGLGCPKTAFSETHRLFATICRRHAATNRRNKNGAFLQNVFWDRQAQEQTASMPSAVMTNPTPAPPPPPSKLQLDAPFCSSRHLAAELSCLSPDGSKHSRLRKKSRPAPKTIHAITEIAGWISPFVVREPERLGVGSTFRVIPQRRGEKPRRHQL